MMDSFIFPGLTTRVVFGAGTMARVEEEVRRLGHDKALVLSTPHQKADAEKLAESLRGLAVRIFHLQERRPGNPSAPPRRPAGANLCKDTRWRGRRPARSRPEALAVGAPRPGPPPLWLRDGRAHRKAVCERQASADRRRARPTTRRAARAAGQRPRMARRAAPPHATASPRGTDRGRG